MTRYSFLPLEERIVLDATAIIYVNAAAHAGGDGSSWAHAYNNLQDALTKAASTPGPDQIWIAKGTYTPSQVYSPNGVTGGASGLNQAQLETFNLPNNVSLYGGFLPGETSLSQRNPLLNPTILSGNLGGGVSAWHVVTAGNDIADTGVTATLDGLTIANGYAAGPDALNGSALLYSHESGGGIYARFGSNLTINNDVFSNDSAGFAPTQGISLPPGGGGLSAGGGGIAAFDNSQLSITNSTFSHDAAGSLTTGSAQGGAIYLYLSSANVSSSVFTDNTAENFGGAISTYGNSTTDSSLTVRTSVFEGNSMVGSEFTFGSGGAIDVFNGSLDVYNSLFDGGTSNWTAAAIGVNFTFDTVHHANIENSTFTNNHGDFEGTITITSLGAANSADVANIINDKFLNNYGGGTSGAIDIDSITTNITNSQFIGNTSGGVGGAVNSDDFYNSLYGTPITTVTVNNSQFIDNTAEGSLANIAAYNGAFSGPTFGSNFSPGGGALSSIWGSHLVVSNSLIVGNTALNGDGGAVLTGGGYLYAGSIANKFATGGSTTLINDIITGNSAQHGNGGAAATESNFPLGTVTGVPALILQNSVVSLNSASGDGGALYAYQSNNTVTGNAFAFDSAPLGKEVYGMSATFNGEASSSPTAASDLQHANKFLNSGSGAIILS